MHFCLKLPHFTTNLVVRSFCCDTDCDFNLAESLDCTVFKILALAGHIFDLGLLLFLRICVAF